VVGIPIEPTRMIVAVGGEFSIDCLLGLEPGIGMTPLVLLFRVMDRAFGIGKRASKRAWPTPMSSLAKAWVTADASCARRARAAYVANLLM
jgi:hypothetical protein